MTEQSPAYKRLFFEEKRRRKEEQHQHEKEQRRREDAEGRIRKTTHIGIQPWKPPPREWR